MIQDAGLAQLLTALEEKPITEIYVPGSLDTEGYAVREDFLPPASPVWRQFRPWWTYVYLELGADTLFMLELVDQYDRIVIAGAGRIECRFDMDNADNFGFAPFLRTVLQRAEQPPRIVSVDLFTTSGLAGAEYIASIGMQSAAGDYIFFEGWNIDGIRLGSSIGRDAWVEWFRGKYRHNTVDIHQRPA